MDNKNLLKMLLGAGLAMVMVLTVSAQNRAAQGPSPACLAAAQNPATLEGVVQETHFGGRGNGSWFVLSASGVDQQIRTGPYWKLAETDFTIQKGDEVQVTGFSSPRVENTFVAQQIKDLKTGATLKLRDDSGAPLWRGRGRGQGNCNRSCPMTPR